MRPKGKTAALAALFLAPLVLSAAARASTIRGDYLESRTADVWTGPCFANGEVNLAGHEAILAWRVRDGSWQGVELAGLSVVAVVRAGATLGDPHADPYPAQAILLVDERATAEQREALAGFAREQAGRLLDDVVRVEAAPIELAVTGHGEARLEAGKLATVRTRCLGQGDRHCRNEETYYPPLTQVQAAQPAYALAQAWTGEGLGTTWSVPDKRSAFVATFER